MMKYCASQISPSEIENLLIQHESVKAVCVVGISDPVAGDLPAAAIIQKEDVATLSESEIEQMVAGEEINCLSKEFQFQSNFKNLSYSPFVSLFR